MTIEQRQQCIQLLSTADSEMIRGNYQEARRLAELVLSYENPDETLLNIAAEDLSNPQLDSSQSTPDLIERFSNSATAFHILATCARYTAQLDEATNLYQRSLACATLAHNVPMKARALGNLGVVEGQRGNLLADVEFTTRALEADESVDNLSGMAMWHNNLGICCGQIGDYTKAIEHFVKAMDLDEAAQNTRKLATRYNNMAMVYEQLGDYPNALDYLMRSVDMDESLGNRRGIAQRLSNTGLVYTKLDRFSEAAECLNRALAIDEELQNPRGVAIRLSNLGEAHAKLGQYEIALQYLNRALDLDRELDNSRGYALRLASIAAVLMQQDSGAETLAEAERLLLEASAISTELSNKHHLIDCHQRLAELYEKQGRLIECVEQLKLHYKLEKEVLSEDAKRHAQNLEQQRLMREQERQFELAKARSNAIIEATNNLLHRVLPTVIADRIIGGEEEIADYFPSVTILFADLRGFTELSTRMPAQVIVRFLKLLFHSFDQIMKKHGCSKIKTIGDGYMAVAGAPEECDDHAERIANAAIDVIRLITDFQVPSELRDYFDGEVKLGVRIGVHTGSVVGGVIGDERFVYDLYSDAVNTAARMESHGEENKVHCSQDFARHLQQRQPVINKTHGSFSFVERGNIEVKGKGIMRTFFLDM